ncbi:methyltransferase domain-containing protein [Streptomyces tsukubensis]|nr:methyltransferase domain-containing protein [Streptomyces tsukubensis]
MLPGEFDALFHGEARSGGFSRVTRIVDPALPPEAEPFSFLCADLLHHIAADLSLKEGEVLADLGCGSGGPGLWLARAAHADLVGIDFSPVAVAHARQRANTHAMKGTAHFAAVSPAPRGRSAEGRQRHTVRPSLDRRLCGDCHDRAGGECRHGTPPRLRGCSGGEGYSALRGVLLPAHLNPVRTPLTLAVQPAAGRHR